MKRKGLLTLSALVLFAYLLGCGIPRVYGQAAATSCCPSIGFFCCDEHLGHWLEGQTARRAGYRLSLDEALEVGRALFEPILAPARCVIDQLPVSS